MFDQMTFVKAFGAILVAALVLLLAQGLGQGLYFRDSGGNQDYAFLVEYPDEEEETADAEPAEELTFEVALAQADPDAGAREFRQCTSCHRLEEGRNGTGPSLYQIVGRDIASVEGFRYSDAIQALEGSWTYEALDAWLANPNEVAPGNAMGSAQAVRNLQDRANLIAYLERGDG